MISDRSKDCQDRAGSVFGYLTAAGSSKGGKRKGEYPMVFVVLVIHSVVHISGGPEIRLSGAVVASGT